jgi:hypothetical protein
LRFIKLRYFIVVGVGVGEIPVLVVALFARLICLAPVNFNLVVTAQAI